MQFYFNRLFFAASFSSWTRTNAMLHWANNSRRPSRIAANWSTHVVWLSNWAVRSSHVRTTMAWRWVDWHRLSNRWPSAIWRAANVLWWPAERSLLASRSWHRNCWCRCRCVRRCRPKTTRVRYIYIYNICTKTNVIGVFIHIDHICFCIRTLVYY